MQYLAILLSILSSETKAQLVAFFEEYQFGIFTVTLVLFFFAFNLLWKREWKELKQNLDNKELDHEKDHSSLKQSVNKSRDGFLPNSNFSRNLSQSNQAFDQKSTKPSEENKEQTLEAKKERAKQMMEGAFKDIFEKADEITETKDEENRNTHNWDKGRNESTLNKIIKDGSLERVEKCQIDSLKSKEADTFISQQEEKRKKRLEEKKVIAAKLAENAFKDLFLNPELNPSTSKESSSTNNLEKEPVSTPKSNIILPYIGEKEEGEDHTEDNSSELLEIKYTPNDTWLQTTSIKHYPVVNMPACKAKVLLPKPGKIKAKGISEEKFVSSAKSFFL